MQILRALLDMLQDLRSGELDGDSGSYVDQLEHTLTAMVRDGPEPFLPLASACLVSLVLATGDTDKILEAAYTLMSCPRAGLPHGCAVPNALHVLHGAATAVGFPGRAEEWSDALVSGATCVTQWKMDAVTAYGTLTEKEEPGHEHNIALAVGDGYLYVHTNGVLQKVGTGYDGTVQGEVVCTSVLEEDASADKPVWLG